MKNVYERFFTISSELFIVTDRHGEVQRVNSRWKDVLGFEPDEVKGRSVCDLIHPDDVKRTTDAREEVRRNGESRDFENRCVHKDGRIVWVKWHGTYDRESEYFYGTGTDVTREKLALQSLASESSSLIHERERALVLRQLIEASKDGFGYCDAGLKALYLNRFLVDELNWPREGARLSDFVSAATRSRYESEMIPAVVQRGGSWEGEVEFVNAKTGEIVPIWQKTFSAQATNGDLRYIAFFATDLRTKRRAEAAIFHSSKMASLGQMAAGIAHEVNNPITIIHGTAGLLKRAVLESAPDLAKVTVGLERIEKTALRISRIIRGLRMFSRSGESDPPIPTALAEILEETLDLCRERFRDYAIDLRIGEVPEVAIRCRPTQISQVLLNLLNNSFDAVSREEERWVRIDFAELEDRVRIAVTDSGPGVSGETERRLMEPFFTTKEPGKGTGLGLPISRGIVEEHGGKLVFVRDVGNTCFTIELPCCRESGVG